MFMQYYYSSDLHRGVAQYALEAGWSLNASMYRSDTFPSRKWDGVVGCFQKLDPFYETTVKPNMIPAVSLTVTDTLPCVLPDNQAIGTVAAEHLLELGYKNFAFYFWQSKAHERMRADALEHKLNPKLHKYYRINYTQTPRLRSQRIQVRLRALRRFLEKAPKPIAIMAPIDDLAVEVIELCDDMGLNVPRDVGVLGVNNDRLICDFSAIPLSSVDNDEYRIGYEGAALLGRIMNGSELPTDPILIQPQGVKIRKSTDLLEITEVPDRQVAIAIRYIAENFTKQINSDDVAAATGISKRPLQDRFTRHIGRSIHEQISQKRIGHAKKLLRDTDYKTVHIAIECGFGSRERFSKSFKQLTGLSPIDFRSSQP